MDLERDIPVDVNTIAFENGQDLNENKHKHCYKVIMADKNDDIIDIRASLFFGVAREVCAREKQRTNWPGHLGILSPQACKSFAAALKTLIEIDDALAGTV